MRTSTRVVVAEDSVLLREGLCRLLAETGFDVVAAVGDGDELLRVLDAGRPDVVVADVRMPPTHTDEGLRAALVIRARWPEVAVLVLSQYVEERYATELLAGDTRGVGLPAQGPGRRRRAASSRRCAGSCDRRHRARPGGRLAAVRPVPPPGSRWPALTPREREVLALMAEGRSNNGIAEALHVGEGAVEKHVSAIFGKFALPVAATDHRRVLAVLAYLASAS